MSERTWFVFGVHPDGFVDVADVVGDVLTHVSPVEAKRVIDAVNAAPPRRVWSVEIRNGEDDYEFVSVEPTEALAWEEVARRANAAYGWVIVRLAAAPKVVMVGGAQFFPRRPPEEAARDRANYVARYSVVRGWEVAP